MYEPVNPVTSFWFFTVDLASLKISQVSQFPDEHISQTLIRVEQTVAAKRLFPAIGSSMKKKKANKNDRQHLVTRQSATEAAVCVCSNIVHL